MDISNYKEENIIREIDHGVEGKVYLYNDNGNKVALKIFYTGKGYNTNDNKELKLKILKNESILKDDMKLLNRMYSMGKFIGYTSLYEPYTPITYFDSNEKKIEFLQSLLKRVQELNSHGIYIGDFCPNNFGFENHKIKLYDIDNFRIDNLNFNISDNSMVEYMRKCKNIKNIDYFCFNWFAFSLLSKIKTSTLLEGNYSSIPRNLKTDEIEDFFYDLKHINDSYVIEEKDGKPKTLLNLLK